MRHAHVASRPAASLQLRHPSSLLCFLINLRGFTSPSVFCSVQKELVRYHEELVQRREKVASMRAAGADEHDVRKQVRRRGRGRVGRRVV